jgi:2,4-dienoyl-CoA reductase-like NADH-dependent reductase (Old Yellow Enzyme family)
MKNIFDETQLGSLTLKNRFFRAAVGDRIQNSALNSENYLTYEKLAKGGIGAILTGFTLVDDREKVLVPIFNLSKDDYISDHKKLTELVHGLGSKIFSQIVYIGCSDFKQLYNRSDPNHRDFDYLAPSPVSREETGVTPREATPAELKSIVESHARAGLRAKKAGYDGVEIHAAHGFFLSQFLSPHFNKRTDDFGGSGENRCRMALEVCRAVKEAVGPDFPVIIKVNVTEKYPDGVILGDVIDLAKKLATDNLDALEISGYWQDLRENDGAFFEKEGTAIAAEADIKVILTGGVREEAQMNKILNNSKREYFGLARPFIKDPTFLQRFAQNN